MQSLFGTEGCFLFSDEEGMYFAGAREGASNQTWISRFHPETGLVEWLSQAPAARVCDAAAYDPVSRMIYVAGGSNGTTGNLTTFEYCQVVPEPATLVLLTLDSVVLVRRRR